MNLETQITIHIEYHGNSATIEASSLVKIIVAWTFILKPHRKSASHYKLANQLKKGIREENKLTFLGCKQPPPRKITNLIEKENTKPRNTLQN